MNMTQPSNNQGQWFCYRDPQAALGPQHTLKCQNI